MHRNSWGISKCPIVRKFISFVQPPTHFFFFFFNSNFLFSGHVVTAAESIGNQKFWTCEEEFWIFCEFMSCIDDLYMCASFAQILKSFPTKFCTWIIGKVCQEVLRNSIRRVWQFCIVLYTSLIYTHFKYNCIWYTFETAQLFYYEICDVVTSVCIVWFQFWIITYLVNK